MTSILKPTKVCKKCGITFTPRVNSQKYCTYNCHANRPKNRDELKKRLKGITFRAKYPKQPCEYCGFDDLRAIHRHHINPSQGNQGGIMFLCANHHYIYHLITTADQLAEEKTKEQVLEILRSNLSK